METYTLNVAPRLRKPEYSPRRLTRLAAPLRMMLRSRNAAGMKFDHYLNLDNISSGGMYYRIGWPMEVGEQVFAVVWFRDGSSPALAVRGTVKRVESRYGLFGVALEFTRHRFL